MKRNNKLLKASGVLLVLTLITSCFVGGTLAKYVSEGDGKDSARVAKWGVEVAVTGDEAFKTTYGKNDASSSVSSNTVASAGSESVTFTWTSSAGSKSEKVNVNDVIAPGTEGTFGGISVTGKPEVAVKIETTAEVDFTGWDVDKSGDKYYFYCPLVFKIGDETICGLEYSGSAGNSNGGQDGFENRIEQAIEKLTNNSDNIPNYPAQTNLSIDKDFSWKWSFSGEDDVDTEKQHYNDEHRNCSDDHEKDQSDELDTLLGDNALGDDAEIPAVYIKVTTTVTQID